MEAKMNIYAIEIVATHCNAALKSWYRTTDEMQADLTRMGYYVTSKGFIKDSDQTVVGSMFEATQLCGVGDRQDDTIGDIPWEKYRDTRDYDDHNYSKRPNAVVREYGEGEGETLADYLDGIYR
jgi:hypothetical protein